MTTSSSSSSSSSSWPAFLVQVDDVEELVKRKKAYFIVKRKKAYSIVVQNKKVLSAAADVEYHQTVLLNLFFDHFLYRTIPYFFGVGLIHHHDHDHVQVYAFQHPCLQEIREYYHNGARRRGPISLQALCKLNLTTSEILDWQKITK